MKYIENFNSIPSLFVDYQSFESSKKLCRCCSIGKVYDCVVPSDGNKSNPKIIIVGEAPGADEIQQQKPFVGKAGKLLRSTLESMGYNNGNSLITNLIPCRPENNKFPSNDTIVNNCMKQWLKKEIFLVKPDIILIIGSKPLKFLLKLNGITAIRGKWYKRKIDSKIIYLMATYHPSYVLRTQYTEEGKIIMENFRDDIRAVALRAKLIH